MSEPTKSQRACIEDTFAVPSAVVAGAGSGKTDTLTRRVVHALLHPEDSGAADIEDILAITYTEKAACELSSRIKEALLAAATPDNGLAEQALKVDGAWISTIHGMASRILRENALSFGIDPAFTVIADEVQVACFDQALESVLAADGDQAAKDVIADLGREYGPAAVRSMVGELAKKMAAAPGSLQLVAPPMQPGRALITLGLRVQELCCRLREAEESSKKPLPDSLLDYREESAAALRRLFAWPADTAVEDAVPDPARMADLEAADAATALDFLKAFPPFPGRPAQAKIPLESCGLLPQAALIQCAGDICLALAAPHSEALIALAECCVGAYRRLKDSRGALDNDDLLALCAARLTDPANASIAERYHRRFKLVMVDEFQDTNQMQVDMINLVAGGDPGEPSSKLCVVGDAQQSIYRFRNADLSVFQEHVRRVEASPRGRRIELGENFRSHGDILAFSKGVFSRVFGEDYLDLLHGRDEGRVTASGQGYRGASPGEDASVPRRVNVDVFSTGRGRAYSDAAAASIARDFRVLADRGTPAGAMAVLLGKMTHAAVYARALEAVGLKCAITGGSVFRDSPEAKLCAALLFALANPRDTESLASVLASDLFGLGAEGLLDLVSLRQEGRGRLSDAFTAQEAPILAPGPVARAVSALRRAYDRTGSDAAAAIVGDILYDSGWLGRMARDGQARAANAFKALRIIESIEEEGTSGILETARRFQAHLQEAKEPPGVLSAEGADFVRIMTIHSSKGLSIPVVAVAEADGGGAHSSRMRLMESGGRTFLALAPHHSLDGLKGLPSHALDLKAPLAEIEARGILEAAAAGDAVSAADFYHAINALDRLGEAEEHQRKLYVAYTRSKEALFVTMKALPKSCTDPLEDGGVPGAIAHRLFGEGGWKACLEGAEAALQAVPLHTAYRDNPAFDIDWEVRFRHIPADAGDEDGEGEDAAGAAAEASAPERESLAYPEPAAEPLPPLQPYRAQWFQGILSASSIGAAAGIHGGEGADAADEPQGLPDGLSVLCNPLDDGDPPAAAAERGTAFHALGEWAALHRGADGSLAPPPPRRIDAMARLYGLNGRQRDELPYLLERWLGSPQAHRVESCAQVVPEQPFWVQLEASDPAARRSPLVLQGFIDLLAYDEYGRGSAYAVDYKTGSRLRTDRERREAYGLQAACYAYALLLQGFDEVVLDFVFVDQADPDHPDRPDVTRFPAPGEAPYDAAALDGLRELIVGRL